ncbi:MAG: ZIP family metal transporter [Candidatus Paceibacterota bacterium]
METLYWIIGASIFGGIFSLIGGLFLLYKENLARRLSLYLVSFAIGALLGAAFFDLIPEALKLNGNMLRQNLILGSVLLGFLTLFIFEKFLKWHHCHDEEKCETHTFTSTVIFGDAIHNFIDGVIIVLSFLVSIPVGIATSLAVFFHEIPQEIGDFGVLLHAGYSRRRVVIINLLSSLATPLGAIIAFLAAPLFINKLPFLLSFAAGSFIYIAATDLLPHIHRKTKGSDFSHFFIIVLGILAIFSIGILLPE